MRPEDLQIGDIVNVHRCECVADGGHFQEWDEYGKVISITEYYITIKYIGREEDYGFEDVNGEDINPIPLTPEILEKNFSSTTDWYFIGTDKFCFRIDKYKDKWDLYFGRDGKGTNLQIKISYVHELQHALRLCGINKEIEI